MKQEKNFNGEMFYFFINRKTNHSWVCKMYLFKDQIIESDYIHAFYFVKY